MATNKKKDRTTRIIEQQLKCDYGIEHPQAQFEVYRYNSVSIRIRVIDPDFSGLTRTERDTLMWHILDKLPEEIRADITLLVLLAPGEESSSFVNREFEDPTPSRL